MRLPQLLLSILLLAFIATARGQCNVDIDDKGEGTIYMAGREELYRNKDLENGFTTLNANFMLIAQKADRNKIKFYLTIYHSKSSYQPIVIPRTVTFTFTSGEELTLAADEQGEPITKGEIKINLCYFFVSLDNIKHLREKPLQSITVKDTRTGETIKASPYSKILAEQIYCLYKKYEQ